jgi:hypothetical protein
MLARSAALVNGQAGAERATLAAAATRLKRSKSAVHRLAAAADIARRRRSHSSATLKKVDRLLAREESIRVIARLTGVSNGTVSNRKQTWRKRLGLPRKVAPYKCRCGNTVIYIPCQICAALAAAKPPVPPQPAGNLGALPTPFSIG